ncbi:hypothetical protein ABIE44_003115 [Marmoricola sp. OAE513]|uniref:DUF2188 domain-containing protein n=1 Tax=Marmoricola sp. OAE513 TaxID=2817894 RepID=UPI001AE243BA
MPLRSETPARPVPSQRAPRDETGDTPAPTPAETPARVTAFFDRSRWSYRIEGEPEPGHSFEKKEPAIAGATYLARARGAELVVENEDGSVSSCRYFGDRCVCHDNASDPRG